MYKTLPLLLSLALTSGCVRKTVDRFTTQRVVPVALQQPDVDRVCKIGEALGHPLAAVTSPGNPADKALIIADAVAGICDEARAWDAELDSVIARTIIPAGPGRIAAVKDGLAREDRLRQRAALRFYSGWKRTNRAFGELGVDGSCPNVKSKDELTLLVGLLSGTVGMLDDKASGGRNSVPLDTLSRVGRAAPCLANADWWHLPSALEASAWIVVPGSGPEGVDPWTQIENAARAGESSGVRLAWAIYAVVAANAGEEERVRTAIEASARAFEEHPSHPDYAMLDQFARNMLRHQSDLIWAREVGHRTLELGELPVDAETPIEPGEDPFAEDPFEDSDPFGTPEPEPSETPDSPEVPE